MTGTKREHVGRRVGRFCWARKIAFAGIACGVAIVASAQLMCALSSRAASAETRVISFKNMHTKETLTVTYKRNGRYQKDAMRKINHILRDWRRNEARKMDPRLIDLAYEVHRHTGSEKPIHVVSGYRSSVTNAALRRRSKGVARNSQHIQGRAMDIYLPDVPVSKLRRAALLMESGGVGYYPRSGRPFIHIDVGNVRHWPRMTRTQLARLFPDGDTRHIPSDGRPLTRRVSTTRIASATRPADDAAPRLQSPTRASAPIIDRPAVAQPAPVAAPTVTAVAFRPSSDASAPVSSNQAPTLLALLTPGNDGQSETAVDTNSGNAGQPSASTDTNKASNDSNVPSGTTPVIQLTRAPISVPSPAIRPNMALASADRVKPERKPTKVTEPTETQPTERAVVAVLSGLSPTLRPQFGGFAEDRAAPNRIQLASAAETAPVKPTNLNSANSSSATTTDVEPSAPDLENSASKERTAPAQAGDAAPPAKLTDKDISPATEPQTAPRLELRQIAEVEPAGNQSITPTVSRAAELQRAASELSNLGRTVADQELIDQRPAAPEIGNAMQLAYLAPALPAAITDATAIPSSRSPASEAAHGMTEVTVSGQVAEAPEPSAAVIQLASLTPPAPLARPQTVAAAVAGDESQAATVQPQDEQNAAQPQDARNMDAIVAASRSVIDTIAGRQAIWSDGWRYSPPRYRQLAALQHDVASREDLRKPDLSALAGMIRKPSSSLHITFASGPIGKPEKFALGRNALTYVYVASIDDGYTR